MCPKSFKKRTKLSIHFPTHKEQKLSCILCRFKSNAPKTMSEHMKSFHENDRHLKCEPCDIWFESEEKLKRHISYHTRLQSRTEKCKRCEKKLLPGLTMKRHMMTKHKKKLACALCGKENFSGIVELNSHIVKEHVSKWWKNYLKIIVFIGFVLLFKIGNIHCFASQLMFFIIFKAETLLAPQCGALRIGACWHSNPFLWGYQIWCWEVCLGHHLGHV